jgi:hypothetical protein
VRSCSQAPLPLQELHHYYEAVRPAAPHRYSPPCRFSCLEFSLTLTMSTHDQPHRSERFPSSTPEPDTELAPPLRRTPIWPTKQAPARLIPGQQLDPGFGLSSLRFRRFISGSLTFAFSAPT